MFAPIKYNVYNLYSWRGFPMLPSNSESVCSLRQSCAVCFPWTFKQSDAYIKKVCVGTITRWLRYVKVCSFSSHCLFDTIYLLQRSVCVFPYKSPQSQISCSCLLFIISTAKGQNWKPERECWLTGIICVQLIFTVIVSAVACIPHDTFMW